MNIYNDRGIASFGRLFGAALRGSAVLDVPSTCVCDAFPLKLSYQVGGRENTGVLQVSRINSVPMKQSLINHLGAISPKRFGPFDN